MLKYCTAGHNRKLLGKMEWEKVHYRLLLGSFVTFTITAITIAEKVSFAMPCPKCGTISKIGIFL
jgi:hypothetical protein